MRSAFIYSGPAEDSGTAHALLKRLCENTDPGAILPMSAREMSILQQCSPVSVSNSASTPTNAFKVVREFEQAVCDYTGAPYCVAVTSCTMALLLACKYLKVQSVEIPKRTYVSVPMSILHAGGRPIFRDEDWSGSYQLNPYPIWDSARRFTSGMYKAGQYICCSFHVSKSLGIDQGGCILHDKAEADGWFRKARFDGRTEGVAPKDDTFILGYHCYLSPPIAAAGLWRLTCLPEHNADLPNDDYPDLSQVALFQK